VFSRCRAERLAIFADDSGAGAPSSGHDAGVAQIRQPFRGLTDQRMSRRSMPSGLTRGWIRFADKDMG
jgi:hypothetical protein